MAYTAKTWVDNSAPSVCAANLNDLETGVADAHTTADRAVAKGVLQAKGDLFGALSASSPTRVVVGADDTVLVADSAQTHGLKWVQIGNAQVLAAAAIAYSKLNLASSIVNADVAAGAAIAKSKLAALAISDSDVAAAAAIAYSKLALAGSIVNADIASSASISAPKIAGFPSDSAKFLRGDATWAAPAGGEQPWLIDIDVFATAQANTNFDTLAVNSTRIYCGEKRSTGAQNAAIVWVPVLAAGTWAIELMYSKDTDGGIYTVQLSTDGAAYTAVGDAPYSGSGSTIDSYNSPSSLNVRTSLTGITIGTTAKYWLRLIMATKNASASAYQAYLQNVRLLRTA